MTTSKTMELFTLMTMWSLIPMAIKTKKTSMLCLILTAYSLMASIMMSLTLNLTLIPFIAILTMAGGLMILFLYFTASTPQHQKPSKKTESSMMALVMMTLLPLIMAMSDSIKQKSPLSEYKDPTAALFNNPSFPMTSLCMLILGLMLVTVIYICSKADTPIRKKKWSS